MLVRGSLLGLITPLRESRLTCRETLGSLLAVLIIVETRIEVVAFRLLIFRPELVWQEVRGSSRSTYSITRAQQTKRGLS